MALILAGLSALAYGIADFSGGYAARKSSVLSVVALSQILGLALALSFIAASGTPLPAPRDLLWGLAAGLAGSAGLLLLYRGLATSLVAIVSPSSALVGALVPMAFGLALGERPSGPALAGAALCLPAVILLGSGSGDGQGADKAAARRESRRALAFGVLAGLGFGGFFVAAARTSPASGLWPLVAARTASIGVALSALLASGSRPRLEKGDGPATAVAGLADMGANILFLLAARSGLLTLVAVVTALYPAPTVLLGRIFLKEKVTLARAAGLVLAIVGVALLSLR